MRVIKVLYENIDWHNERLNNHLNKKCIDALKKTASNPCYNFIYSGLIHSTATKKNLRSSQVQNYIYRYFNRLKEKLGST